MCMACAWQVCTDIVLLEGKQLHYFVGDYDDFTRKYASFAAERRKRAQAEHKELARLQGQLQKGGGDAGSKAGRKQMKERIEEIKGAAPLEKEYKVVFDIPAASRALSGTLVSMAAVGFRYAP